jgi:Phage integrase family
MKDAILLAVLTAQREGDLLAVTSAHAIEVMEDTDDGEVPVKKIRLVQSKRGRHIEVPFLPPLLARLEAMAQRRIDKGYTCDELIVDSHIGQGFNQNTFQQRFRAFRRAVADGRPDLGLPPCEAIRNLTFQKLRNTSLTWLKKTKADDDEFMAISGHARSSLSQVMPHYYTPGSEEAASGIAKMWTWMQRRGIKL